MYHKLTYLIVFILETTTHTFDIIIVLCVKTTIKEQMKEILKVLSEILKSDSDEDQKLSRILEILGGIHQDDIGDTKLDIDLFNRWIDRQNLSKNSILAYKGKFNLFLGYSHSRGVTFVRDVTECLTTEYITKIYKEKHSADYDVMILRKIWKDMFPKSPNPWNVSLHIVPIPTKKNLTHRTISKKEMKKIDDKLDIEIQKRKNNEIKTHNHLDSDVYEELRDAMKFSKFYGMRISSFSNMKMTDFRNYRNRKCFLHIPEKTKNVKTRPLELPIIEPIADVLERRYSKKKTISCSRSYTRDT